MRPLRFWLLGFPKSEREGSMWIRVQTSTWRLSKMLCFYEAALLGWGMTGNEHSHRCHAKAPGLKNRTKKSGVSWSLDKTEDRKRKKIREKCSVMQFHPQGTIGKYHTILPQKMLVKILTGSNIMTLKKARKCHINDFRWVFLFYSFLSN